MKKLSKKYLPLKRTKLGNHFSFLSFLNLVHSKVKRKMHSATLPVYPSLPSISRTRASCIFFTAATSRKLRHDSSLSCKASKESCSSLTDFDLYDLLGVDSSSDQAQIKLAYRGLQKRCHPDIAGPPGHDMAIILNEAYSLLSDPILRSAYDKEQAKVADLRGYTGKPIYSTWSGSEEEKRAVFVDEVKCVGCLKCALFADKTFAIETVYGRARVVAQWADPEDKIQEAIGACPVDCISFVKRADLAALEFLMSKQPRGNVRIGAGNTVGTRVSNIFADLEKFQDKYEKRKASKDQTQEADAERDGQISAIQAIRAISNWLYWQSPRASTTSRAMQQLKPIAQDSIDSNIKKLRDAAQARKEANETVRPVKGVSSIYIYKDEYWVPSSIGLPEAKEPEGGYKTASKTSALRESKVRNNDFSDVKKNQRTPLQLAAPLGIAIVAAYLVRLKVEVVTEGVREHIGGPLALEIVNSSWLPSVLVGITWYLIGSYLLALVIALRSKS